MARGKFEKRRRPILPLIMILVALIALGSTAGGVAAYLSISTPDSVVSTFTVRQDPTVTVTQNSDSSCTVSVPAHSYPVFLRVAVAANTINDGNYVADNSGSVTVPSGWLFSNGFYYCPTEITDSVSFDFTAADGYRISVAAQVIQAVGTVDGGSQTARANAWGN